MAFGIHGLTRRERDDLPVALGRDRAEQRAVGCVDERVLADPHLVESREIAGGAERVDAGAGRDGRADDERGHDQQEDEQRPPTLALAASAANGEAEIGPTLWSPAGRAHAAMVAIVPSAIRRRAAAAPLTRLGESAVRVRPCRTTRAARRPRSGCSSGAAQRSGCSRSSWCSGSTGRSTPAAASGTAPASTSSAPAIDVWARWDSDWFLRIAENGYSWPSSTPAFFPLYPLLVAGLGRLLLGHYLLAGVLVSLAAGAAAFVLLYRLTCLRLGEEAARHTVLFLAVAPTSLFFGAVYSESLFLLLAVATFLLAERGRFWQAGAAAGLALLTRSAGVALLPALVVLAWRAPDRRRALAGIAVAPLLFAIYPALLAIWIGHPLAFLDAQKVVWERRLSPAGPLGGVVAAVQDRELLDLGVAFALIALGIVAWRRIGAAYGLYTLTSVALPLTFVSDKVPLWSMQRFAVVVFPAFMALATLARSRRAVVITTTILAAGLCVYVVRWALWYWVA